jgi:hypothetical protein
MPTQSLSSIGFSKETTFGTFVAPTKFVPGTGQISPSNTVTRPTQSRATRSQVIDAVTAHTVSAQVSCEFTPEVISQLIAGWFGVGSDTTTGSGTTGYTHALTPQASVPSFSLEIDNDAYSRILAQQAVGAVVDQFTMTYQAQQLITSQYQFVGQRQITPATPGTPSNPTPAFNTLQPMDFSLLAATINGTASTQLISATLTMANNTQPVASSNGQLYVTRLQPTLRNVTFSTTLDFLDSTLFTTAFQTAGSNPAYSQTTLPIVLSLVSAAQISGSTGGGHPYTVTFTLPTLRASDQYQISAASDVLQQQVSWSVTQGSGSAEILATIINSETSALA